MARYNQLYNTIDSLARAAALDLKRHPVYSEYNAATRRNALIIGTDQALDAIDNELLERNPADEDIPLLDDGSIDRAELADRLIDGDTVDIAEVRYRRIDIAELTDYLDSCAASDTNPAHIYSDIPGIDPLYMVAKYCESLAELLELLVELDMLID